MTVHVNAKVYVKMNLSGNEDAHLTVTENAKVNGIVSVNTKRNKNTKTKRTRTWAFASS